MCSSIAKFIRIEQQYHRRLPSAYFRDCQRLRKCHLSRHPYPAGGQRRNNYLSRFALKQFDTEVTEQEATVLLMESFTEGDFISKELSQLLHLAFREGYGANYHELSNYHL